MFVYSDVKKPSSYAKCPIKTVTCSHMAPVMVTGKGLTLPRPRFSLFLWLLKSFSSLFSSSSRALQYRTWSRKEGLSVRVARHTDLDVIYMS